MEIASGGTQVNLALRGKASQRDTYGDDVASRAIDGNRDSNWAHKSCAITASTTNAWWRVDLQNSYMVTSIIITNRGDCCAERLDGAQIRVGNSLDNNGNNNPVVATVSHIPAGVSQNFTLPEPVEGRYVNVFLPGSGDKYLQLCEVEVYGKPKPTEVNLALRGKATQRDTYGDDVASRAIDGNRDSNWAHKSCAITASTTNAWWRVDLQNSYMVTSIIITNRGDCCAERLDGAQIRVGNSLDNNGNNNPVVATVSHIPAGVSQSFTLPEPVEGRYVNVFLPGSGDKYLQLCEVEVYGFEKKKSMHTSFLLLLLVETASVSAQVNVAPHGEATQIDTYNELGAASNAIDGHRTSIYYSKSCSHTATTTDPWWRVDLREYYMITSITITNRGDCCAHRLDGAQIHIGNSLENNGNNNPVVATISHILEGRSKTFTLLEPVEGRYVNVFLPGTDKYLTLCEVEVYGQLKRPVNWAIRGEATQIDSYEKFGDASNAINGNRDSDWAHGSCSHTGTTNNPWWRVDMREPFMITSITITNRGDCCAERLDGAQIRVGNSLDNNGNNNPVVATVSHIAAGVSQSFPFAKPVEGRYVNVFLPGGKDKYLTLCEVEVYGNIKETVNLALNGEATQIDSYDALGDASNAIDGNRDSNWAHNSCSHTGTTSNPWWRLDLRDFFMVTSIIITNRGDCCAQRLDGAQIRVGSYLDNNGNNNPVVATVSHIPAGVSQSFTLPEPVEGRYVNVFLPVTDKYLTLCEVEVYGNPKKTMNLALNGQATQIDSYEKFGDASNAIDGNRDSDWAHDSCSHTGTTNYPGGEWTWGSPTWSPPSPSLTEETAVQRDWTELRSESAIPWIIMEQQSCSGDGLTHPSRRLSKLSFS
ncbi:hypothetical protein WMY93_031294 [Mugilogobius chulae]|uniref:F5/8 type C domain-containing protein n=1 Tax=Mugilogobius chulae TaxID=88201 RepID=A0AAW0MIU7_9GOBI